MKTEQNQGGIDQQVLDEIDILWEYCYLIGRYLYIGWVKLARAILSENS